MATKRTPGRADRTSEAIYQLNIALLESRPLIWRRIQVPAAISLPALHRTFQITLGWEDYHLHEFRFGGKAYTVPDPEDHHFGRESHDERRFKLSSVVSSAGSSFEYLYDFGDGWRHEVLLEAILPVVPRKRYPVCLGGARSTPPEDVGGIGGYERYLEALAGPKHDAHAAMLAWRGRFDPEYFPITRVNRQLREAFPSSSPQRKSVRASVKNAKAATGSSTSALQARIVLGPGDRIPVPLSARDRELIIEDSFADAELTDDSA